MTLQSSGPINVGQINIELGRPSNAVFSMNGAAERALAGVPSGPISMASFYGKGSGSPPVETRSAAYLGSNSSGTGLSFGTAHAGRRLIAMINWSEGAGGPVTVSSATIGGIAATIHVQRGHNGGATGLGAALVSAAVPSGTSGNVVVNFSGGGATVRQVGLIRIVGYNAGPSATGTDESSTPTQLLSVSLATPAVPDGLAIGVYTGSTLTDAFPITWNIIERYDISNTIRAGGALHGVGSGGITITADQGSILNAGNDLVAATWG